MLHGRLHSARKRHSPAPSLGHSDVVFTPVSYTHLDVYKRQHRHLICIGCAVAAHRLSLIHI
ncbi:hypothetical protein [Burkholderia plantarii]|uniref:hypothetical protein n=1 Tax=Burkholderia plantarii TaxID=41899 RepID=UPI00114CC87F|nr:hypothetical protein [Burkholderia plantarii]